MYIKGFSVYLFEVEVQSKRYYFKSARVYVISIITITFLYVEYLPIHR